ncbi:MAG: transketolase [Gammaproteobacteria bacterium]|nr:transketolase [Gammaproteobacteria bacterium]
MTTRRELANCIRFLAIDAVQNANSGHPGMPMGMADIAEVLWNDFLKHSPAHPNWPNRDRFILSNGHGSMLQYALLHLTGYELSLEDLKNFRQLHSKTPGHPEYGITIGVETTTGPLGQGIAHGVGLALAEKLLAQQFNRDNFNIVDHHTYVFMGDGCMMEGISHEVCSLAGTWQLNKLIAFWDDNNISIDGDVNGWFRDNTPERFRAYGWHVIEHVDGHDPEKIKAAISEAHQSTDKPVLICTKTIIGFGSPNKAASHEVHGSPLGETEIKAVRENLNWSHAPFEIPQEYYSSWNAKQKGLDFEKKWQSLFLDYSKKYPELAAEFKRRIHHKLPANFQSTIESALDKFKNNPENIASRKASQNCINALVPILPEFLGGSADLTGSNLTMAKTAKAITPDDFSGNYIYYGVREFGMSAIMCGISLHGGFIPFGGTFLTFCDYARNAVRLAALMKIRVIFVYSHDSIGLGEDGPTHQPVEHIGMLRLTPGLSLWRPCDPIETMVAWQASIENMNKPTCLLLSRQNLPQKIHTDINLIKKGGYILSDSDQSPEIILIATGSEVYLATEAAKILRETHHKSVRVVSMPSVDVFLSQDENYQESVLPRNIKNKIAIEAGAKDIWYRFVGLEGKIIGMDTFGESAPAPEIYKALGITVENIVQTASTFSQKINA